ncbi:dsDNA nuclease domain-containing protein [Allopusillimonas ginsengisoli]|uniref:dsDNA nuclease domain-containing protein n=1 Tax=Allopusillimonas ginsengisoli TaxID=453575 RepID=UPI0039C23197
MVTKRDVASILEGFKTELEKRILPDTTATERGAALCKKFKKFCSPRKRDFSYWTENFVWQVYGEVGALAAININKLAKLAERYGNRPNYNQLQGIYDEFLELADKAATADVKAEAATKIIRREPTLALLRQRLDEADTVATSTSKPYRTRLEPFLVEFHASPEEELLRSVTAFDVRYSLKKWRCDGLATHLIEWLPEFSLKASEIVNIQAHMLRLSLHGRSAPLTIITCRETDSLRNSLSVQFCEAERTASLSPARSSTRLQ